MKVTENIVLRSLTNIICIDFKLNRLLSKVIAE